MTSCEDTEREPDRDAAEDQPEEPGAEGGSGSEDAEKLPGAPTDAESEAGDTDQHSDA